MSFPLEEMPRLFEEFPDPVVITNPGGAITGTNWAFAELLGYARQEIIGRRPTDFYAAAGEHSCTTGEVLVLSTADAADKVRSHDSLLQARTSSTITTHLAIITGAVVPVQHSISFIRDSRGEVAGCFGVLRDMTEPERSRIALQKGERRFYTFFEYAPDGIYISDSAGTFIDGNRAAEKLCGYQRHELIGKNYFDLDLLSPDQFPKAMELLDLNSAGSPTGPDEFLLKRKNGNTLTVEICTYPVIMQGEHRIMGIARDITERKKSRDDLERKVKERTRDLEDANTALRVLLKGRDEDRAALEDKIIINMKELVLPYLDKIRNNTIQERRNAYIDMLETNLRNITSPFLQRLTIRHLKLTKAETRVANLIRQAKSSREIAEALNLSRKTIDFHRDNIRKKCGIKNNKINLRTFLMSIS